MDPHCSVGFVVVPMKIDTSLNQLRMRAVENEYRNILLSDSIIVPTFQLFSEAELQSNEYSRESDIFYGQLETNDNSPRQRRIVPSIAVGRLPVENAIDAERVVEKLRIYKLNPLL